MFSHKSYTIVSRIRKERDRQLRVEGYTPDKDDQYTNGELVKAAGAYLTISPDYIRRAVWPWDKSTFKPTPDDRVKELIKAGALIVAEIERLERAAARMRAEEIARAEEETRKSLEHQIAARAERKDYEGSEASNIIQALPKNFVQVIVYDGGEVTKELRSFADAKLNRIRLPYDTEKSWRVIRNDGGIQKLQPGMHFVKFASGEVRVYHKHDFDLLFDVK